MADATETTTNMETSETPEQSQLSKPAEATEPQPESTQSEPATTELSGDVNTKNKVDSYKEESHDHVTRITPTDDQSTSEATETAGPVSSEPDSPSDRPSDKPEPTPDVGDTQSKEELKETPQKTEVPPSTEQEPTAETTTEKDCVERPAESTEVKASKEEKEADQKPTEAVADSSEPKGEKLESSTATEQETVEPAAMDPAPSSTEEQTPLKPASQETPPSTEESPSEPSISETAEAAVPPEAQEAANEPAPPESDPSEVVTPAADSQDEPKEPTLPQENGPALVTNHVSEPEPAPPQEEQPSEKVHVQLYVKAHARHANEIGDCPFSHRVMLIMKLKHIGGDVFPINLTIRPPEFEDFCAKNGVPCKVPILMHEETVIADSNAIADYLDKLKPEPNLKCADKKTNAAGDKVFLKFSALIKNRDKTQDEKLEAALVEELKKLDTFLGASPGTYLDGDEMKHPDCSLLPKLQHVKVASKYYKKFDIPEELSHLHGYLNAAAAHPGFKSTVPSDNSIIEGWRKHVS